MTPYHRVRIRMECAFQMNDGRFHKLANAIGESMKLHPHGDASISDALVVLANKGFFKDVEKDLERAAHWFAKAAEELPGFLESMEVRVRLDLKYQVCNAVGPIGAVGSIVSS